MKGINTDFKPIDSKLNYTKQMLGEVLVAIIARFVAIQEQNPMLALEACFRFQNSQAKNDALNNYFKDKSAV